jgi:hypothetical protein
MGQKVYRPAWDVAEPALPALGWWSIGSLSWD